MIYGNREEEADECHSGQRGLLDAVCDARRNHFTNEHPGVVLGGGELLLFTTQTEQTGQTGQNRR